MADTEDQTQSGLSDPDVHLMLKFQNGSKSSFEKLLVKYFKRVLNFIYRFIGDRDIAEELTQEVFIRVFNNAKQYKPQADFQTWLFTIAKNVSLNELRRHKTSSLSTDIPSNVEGVGKDLQVEDKHAQRPDQQMIQNENVVIIRSAINSLPENQRLAVILRRYDHFTYEEIAKTMETSIKAVKSLLNRAKESLKVKLRDL